MNLRSCDNCGVVIDLSKRKFPEDIMREDYSIDERLGVWDGNKWVGYIECPVCKNRITKDED